MIEGEALQRLRSEKSSRKNEGIEGISCGMCAFFGKPAICLRREKYAGAIPCRLYERKTWLQDEAASPMFPLLPDTGLRESREEIMEQPSALWYLVPFLFGILGGIVAYIAVKDKDEDMASGLLIFGIIWTVVAFVLYIIFISSYLSTIF